ELLPVLLGCCHIKPEPESALQELAAACCALWHEPDAYAEDDSGQQDRGADESPPKLHTEQRGGGNPGHDEAEPKASPGGASGVRPGREQLATDGIRVDLAYGLSERGRERALELGELDLLAPGEDAVEQALLVWQEG